MMFFLVEKQAPACDYSIGCGIRITQLHEATSMLEAKDLAAERLKHTWKVKQDYAIEEAELLEVATSLDLEEFLDQKKAERIAAERVQREADQRKADEDEFERLRIKLGK
jgi:hypothetical protein